MAKNEARRPFKTLFRLKSLTAIFKRWWPNTRILSRQSSHVYDQSHGLGVFTFPWGRVTDTRENESPLTVYNLKVEGRYLAWV
ncbi:hypothetical protein CRG98_008680 [Punica granatum]|uniref:Uncharacterized protein n=1 Tax=Punica granatum TaxID=22663 RepID=A0A2I0KR58_PUNGR|nr:hypothetical protein CRG98_008680 [Punica granatum]